MPADACPQCGAPLVFRSAASPVKVCDFCRATVVRTGDALADAGNAAIVPDDVSPWQVGAAGRDGNQPFEVLGRVRWRWTGGSWNEWFVRFEDGSTGWLGDAAGRFMLLRACDAAASRGDAVEALRDGRLPTVGAAAIVAGSRYEVVDVREVVCVASEGELPFPAPAGAAMTSIDLGDGFGGCASLQKEGAIVFAYAGRYRSLGDHRPRGLRAIEGWTMPDFAR